MPGLIQRVRWRFLLFWAAILSASLTFEVWLIRALWGAFFRNKE